VENSATYGTGLKLLSPVLSTHLVERLTERLQNERTLDAIAASLDAPSTYSDNRSLQEDAVSLALKAFGLAGGEAAARVDTTGNRETSLAGLSIHDAARRSEIFTVNE
jgi:hypothetical protein